AQHGWAYASCHWGRLLEQWAAGSTLEELRGTFAHYEPRDITVALTATMTLFRRLAQDVARCANYRYPERADNYATEWVSTCLALQIEARGQSDARTG